MAMTRYVPTSRALELFPEAKVVGDDWDWEGVRRAVQDVCRERGLRYENHGVGWRILTDTGVPIGGQRE